MKFRFAALFCAFVVSLQAQNPVMDAAAPAAPTLQIINHNNHRFPRNNHINNTSNRRVNIIFSIHLNIILNMI
jgi:hypothetical protein